MDLKALAIDLDGTLLVGEDLSAENRDAVRRAADAGFEVIIATARWRQMAERVANEIGLNGPIIACSGAQVYLPGTGSDIFDHRLPAAFTEELYRLCNEMRCIATITTDSSTVIKLDGQPDLSALGEEVSWTPALDPETHGQPRIAAVQGSAIVREIREHLLPQYLDDINLYDSIGPNGKIIITITASAANKGRALLAATGHLGIDPKTVLAFGDAENDLEMFKVSGASVAMGQADETVRNGATHVTLANTEHGVARAIHTLLDQGSLDALDNP